MRNPKTIYRETIDTHSILITSYGFQTDAATYERLNAAIKTIADDLQRTARNEDESDMEESVKVLFSNLKFSPVLWLLISLQSLLFSFPRVD